jgi:hypothetical protein
VDAQEFPAGVDVTLVKGAVTENVPAMKHFLPTNKLLQQVHVERADENKVIPKDGVPPQLKHARAHCA